MNDIQVAGRKREEPHQKGRATANVRSPAAAVWAAVIVGLYLSINFCNIGCYGISTDEPAGIDRAKDTFRIISSVFTGSAYVEQSDAYRYHPSFYAFLSYELASLLERLSMDPIAAGHVLNLLTSSLGLVILFLFARRLFNDRVGVFSMLLLALFPRFIAHSHFNGKDIPVMVLSVLTLYLLYLAIVSKRLIFWAAGGVAFGLSVITKLDALLIVGIIWYTVLTASLVARKPIVWQISGKIVFSLVGVFTVYLLWPALWLNPLHIFSALRFFSSDFNICTLSYLNTRYSSDNLPWHYTPLHVLAVTPTITLVFLLIGAIRVGYWVKSRQNTIEASLLISWILLPLIPRIFGFLLQYDGMRHVFILIPALTIVAALGLEFCIKQISKAFNKAIVTSIFILSLVTWLGYEVVQIHPYEGSYLNEVVRAIIPNDHLDDYFDYSSWGTPLYDGIQWLNKYAPPNATVSVLGDRELPPYIGLYSLRKDLKVEEADSADFIVTSHRAIIDRVKYESAFIAKCYNTPLVMVYKRRTPPKTEARISSSTTLWSLSLPPSDRSDPQLRALPEMSDRTAGLRAAGTLRLAAYGELE